MPRRTGVQHRPIDFLADPSLAFAAGVLVDGAPVEARAAHHIARHAVDALDGRALIAVCRDAGLNRSTVQDLVAGRRYSDVATVAKLGAALGVSLWPS